MPAPAAQPQWDTNLTHVLATIAGHKNDGFGTSEVPASDELNYWMNLVYQWTNYLGGLAGAQTVVVPIFDAGGGAISPGASVGAIPANSSPTIKYVPIPALYVGRKITEVRARVGNTSPAGMSSWVALTAYAVGNRVINGANTYRCITAGTSAAATGPTGTGADITDGTVHWAFVVAHGSAGDGPATISLISDTDGGLTTIASSQNDDHADTTFRTVTITGLSTIVAAGKTYWLTLTDGGVSTAGLAFQHAEIDVTLP